jgi:hypothetical protein
MPARPATRANLIRCPARISSSWVNRHFASIGKTDY